MPLSRSPHLSVLLLSLGCAAGCIQTQNRSAAKDDVVQSAEAAPKWVFSLPDCLPACEDQDRIDLTERGRIEGHIVEAIDQAETEVSFSMYTFSRRPIYEALVRAAERGVTVRGLVDDGQFRNMGDQCSPVEGCRADGFYASSSYLRASLSERLQMVADRADFRSASNTEKLALLFLESEQGSQIKPLPGGRRLVHNKFALIDRNTLVNGSGNWSSTAVSVNLENLTVRPRTQDPTVVDSFVCAFDVLWQGDANLFQNELRTCEGDRVLFSPAQQRGRNPAQLIAAAANNAQHSIDVAMHHLTNRTVYRALEQALDRGVSIRFLFDDDDCNSPLDAELERLVNKGAEIHYMPTTCSIFQLSHNKFGIFDNSVVINGSANWSNSGLFNNYENFVVYAQASDVAPFREFFAKAYETASSRSACECDHNTAACQEQYCIGASPFDD